MKEGKRSRLVGKSLAALLVAILLAPMLVVGVVAQGNPAAMTNGALCVDSTVAGPGTGVCWTDPYKNLQDAIAAATSGTEIWVKGRTTGGTAIYYPDEGSGQTNDSQTATFQLKDGVGIYGGFAGTETTRTERDWRANVTVLSGDIDQNDTISDPTNVVGIITNPDDIVGSNSYHVVTGSGVATTAILDGFFVTAGSATSSTEPHDRGGGMLNVEGSPTLSNLGFVGNQAKLRGGALYNQSGTGLSLTNVAFKSNRTTEEIIGLGGGMYSERSNPALTNVLFSGNLAYTGAGMANAVGAPVLTNVTASGNRAQYVGGGLSNVSGVPQIRNSIFANNEGSAAPGTIYENIATTAGSDYPAISYSLVQGSGGSGGGWVPETGTDGGHNIDADPRFYTAVNPSDAPTHAGDLRISYASPAIDAGDSALNTTTEDLGGLARKSDGNRDGSVVIDMGAYEAPTPYVIFLPLIFR